MSQNSGDKDQSQTVLLQTTTDDYCRLLLKTITIIIITIIVIITITKPSRRSHLRSWVELDNWHLVTMRRKSTCRLIHLLNKPSGKAVFRPGSMWGCSCTRWCWPARWAPPLVPATLSLCHPRWHRPHGSCWKGQSQSRECFPEKEDFMKMKDEDKENDPVDERGVDSIRQPPSFWRLKNNKFASGTWKNQSTQILGNIKRHIITSKWNRNPVNVGFDKIALWRHWLAQVFQILKHLRLSHRCPLEVLELGSAAKPLFLKIRHMIIWSLFVCFWK